MKKLLDCFDYLKRYHSELLDLVSIMLELFIFKQEKPEILADMIAKSSKRQIIRDDFHEILQNLIGTQLYVPINNNVNIAKILKKLQSGSTKLYEIESFLNVISQKRTMNKLYDYSTPKEINDLLALLLDLQDNDEVYNPCYGIGTIFLSLGNLNPNIHLYGEEIDFRLSNIAKLIARLAKISTYKLFVNNILKQPIFKAGSILRKFNKVICNPPIYAHIGVEQLKEDERFEKFGVLAKNYPELVFLTNALAHLKERGVFIVRNQVLQKSFLEKKLRNKLVQECMIEAIIELPKNIFPHQNSEFSILVISHNNKDILHINANCSHFYTKEGKYNKLTNIDEIMALFRQKKVGKYSKITSINDIDTHDLRASYYLANKAKQDYRLNLADTDMMIFRGQRVYGGSNDTEITYYDVGVADFATYGFSTHFSHKRIIGNKQKIQKYRLKPYDILLSLRGIMPKVTILGEFVQECIAVANAGILILRLKDKDSAIGLYCYFFSNDGFAYLKSIYDKSGMLYIDELLSLNIPPHYLHEGKKIMQDIESLKHEFYILEQKLQKLKQA